jgi:hypothetical protein
LEYVNLNLVPIAVATLLGLLIGLVHFLLSRPGERPAAGFVVLTAIAEFWLAAILAGALILSPEDLGNPYFTALATTIVIWIGFVAPVLLVNLRFRDHPGPMAAADALHWLAVMVVQAMVMTAIGLTAPPV